MNDDLFLDEQWLEETGAKALKVLKAIVCGPEKDDSPWIKETALSADAITKFYACKELLDRCYGKVKHSQKVVNYKELSKLSTEELIEHTNKQVYISAINEIAKGNEKVILTTLKAIDIRYRHQDDLMKGNDDFNDGFRLAIIDDSTDTMS
jgi:hypothetical protein